MPSKHIKLSESLIALSAFVLKFLESPKNLDRLWKDIGQINNSSFLPANHSYDNFLLSIDYLYMAGIVDINSENQIYAIK